jgi:CMP-N-acetylneuraminic acid synthetase
MSAPVVGFVPSKLNSQRLPRKNVRPLGQVPLINYALDTLDRAAGVDDTVVYASDREVMDHVVVDGCRFVERPAVLDGDGATVQDFVNGFIADVRPKVVVLLHATSPFIAPGTVERCVEAVTSGRHRSAFVALEARRFAWYQGAPLNYRLDRATPRTQDLEPVLIEQSGCYVFTSELFTTAQRRIDDNPFICVVDELEGHDIDTALEFRIAEALLPMAPSASQARDRLVARLTVSS